MQKSKIQFNVTLDENKIPENITWIASDGSEKPKETKSILVSIWDEEKKQTLKIDLWTKDMPVDSMKNFFSQTLASLSASYRQATSDDQTADKIEYLAKEISQDNKYQS